MEFKEFAKEYTRLCLSYPDCIGCPIAEEINNSELPNNCRNIDYLSTINCESIVKKWVKEHPIKTYESDFKDKINDLLKIFPNHKVKKFVEDANINIYESFCVADFYFNGDAEKAGCEFYRDNACRDCWKREINEQ